MHDPRPGEVDRAVPEVQRRAEVGQPPAAPHPHSVDRVDDRTQRDLREEEPGERNPLCNSADDDVAGRLHEHDLEQEEHHHADVVGTAALQEEAVRPDDSGTAVTDEARQRRHATQVGDRCDTAEHEGEADRVVREQRNGERGDVHHHHVPGVLCPREPGDQEREPHLHEEHEEARDQHPGEVDRDAEMPRLGGQLVQARLRDGHVGRGRRVVGETVEPGPGRISRAVVPPHCTDDDQADERHQAERNELLALRHVPSLSTAVRAISPATRSVTAVNVRTSGFDSGTIV